MEHGRGFYCRQVLVHSLCDLPTEESVFLFQNRRNHALRHCRFSRLIRQTTKMGFDKTVSVQSALRIIMPDDNIPSTWLENLAAGDTRLIPLKPETLACDVLGSIRDLMP